MRSLTELLLWFTGIGAGLIAILSYIAKTIFEFVINKRIEIKKSELQQQVESFKFNLQKESELYKLEIDKSLEEYRSQLEILRLKNQVVFSKLHDTRATVISDIYKKLITLDSSLYSLTIPLKVGNDFAKEEKERMDNTFEAFNDFNAFYNDHRIYFSKRTCELLDKMRADIKRHIGDYTEKEMLKAWGAQGAELVEAYKKAAKVWEIVKQEMPILKEALEDEFRRILGVDDEEE